MEYVCIADGVANRRLVPSDEDIQAIVVQDRDFYKSIFLYGEHHYKHFKTTGSLAGISDVTTDRLVWDFDSKDINAAQTDAKELCARLLQHGINESAIQIAFSGMKGFSIEVETDQRFSPDEFKSINLELARDLKTNDNKILDAARIFRIVGTRHNKSGLYKYPLSLSQLSDLTPDDIKLLAVDISNADEFDWDRATLPSSIIALKGTKTVEKTVSLPTLSATEASELDFKFKPKGFSNCKFAIMNGFFPAGSRSNSLLALAATCRGQGYPKEVAYNILKAAARLQGQRTDSEPFAKDEIWNKVIEQVYGSNWKGAQFSCKNQPWLKELCDSLGTHKCKQDSEIRFVEVSDMGAQFEDYSINIEKNTIKTGLSQLDDNIQLTVGMPVALLGAPSSGKTSLSLNILNNTSKAGISSVFFSMDMYGPLVYMKQIQKLEGLSPKAIHHIFKHEPKRAAEIKEKLREEYKNVKFSLKAGHTVQEMRDIITEHQDTTGDKVKLVLVDYLECISGPYSDATANSAKIAGELRDFATEMSICGITLVQPPKSAGDASYPLTSMRQIKGSSMLEQSFRAILGIYRDGFGPHTAEDDKFLTVNALKNTMGPLFSIDHYWKGQKGEILEIDEEGEQELAALRKRKAAQASGKDGDSW